MSFKLKDVRLAFPELWEATSFEEGGRKKFSAALLIRKDDPQVKAIKEALLECAVAKWGVKGNDVARQLFKADRAALRDGDDESKAKYDGYEEHWYVNASNDIAPTVLDRDKSPLGQRSGRPYSGCYVNAVVEFWAQDNKYGKRLNATLMGVQFFRDGDAFAGGRAASGDDFEDLSVGDEGLTSPAGENGSGDDPFL